jgi:ABC-type microcin C transport system permease subunit YejE
MLWQKQSKPVWAAIRSGIVLKQAGSRMPMVGIMFGAAEQYFQCSCQFVKVPKPVISAPVPAVVLSGLLYVVFEYALQVKLYIGLVFEWLGY